MWERRDRASLLAARDLFRLAAERDSTYAEAFAGLADAYSLLAFDIREQGQSAWEPAERAARIAVRLNPRSAEARTSLALTIAYGQWNWTAALEEYNRALELDPEYAVAWYLSAELFLVSGQPDSALARTRRAMDLDPESAVATVLHSLAWRSNGEIRQAVRHLWDTAALQPGWAVPLADLLRVYGQLGHRDSLRLVSQRFWELTAPGDEVPDDLIEAGVRLHSGEADAAEAARFVHAWERYGAKNTAAALAFATGGHVDSAFARIETAIARRNEWLPVFLSYFERQTPVGRDPRWASVVERVRDSAAR